MLQLVGEEELGAELVGEEELDEVEGLKSAVGGVKLLQKLTPPTGRQKCE